MRGLIGGAVVAGVAIFAGVGAMDDDTTRDESGEIVDSGGLGVYAFQVGDCIQFWEPTAELVESVEGVPCSEPHDAQLYVEFDLIGEEFPGIDAVGENAELGCWSRFEEAIGVAYEQALELDFTMLHPIEEGWEAGDREVSCFVTRVDGARWTGSHLAADTAEVSG